MSGDGHLRWARNEPATYHLSWDGLITACGIEGTASGKLDEWLSIRSIRVADIPKCRTCQSLVGAMLGLPQGGTRA